MACSGILASAVGLLVFITLTTGQTDLTRPIPGCDSRDVSSGIYMFPHPSYVQVFVHCSNNNQELLTCAPGTIFDTRISQCNHIAQAISSTAPCAANTVGRNYPGTCCENYYRCNGEVLVLETCPAGQVFNAQSGQCGQGTCVDHKTCSRSQPPSGTQWTCNKVADPSNPCNFQTNVNGTLGPSQSCAEGTAFDVGVCTCIVDTRNACMRTANSSGSRTQDEQCRGSWVCRFDRFAPGTNNPQATSEKTGAVLADYIQVVNGRYGNSEVTLFTNPQTNAMASVYLVSFSNKEVANYFVAEFVFRAEQSGTFEIFSNNRDGACVPTISINGTYNGNGGYQVSGFITGTTQIGVNQQVNSVAQLTANINVAANEFILVRVIFDQRGQLQLGNRGSTGTSNGPMVSPAPSGVIGEKLAYTKCGFQILRGLSGILKSIIFREGCINPAVIRT